MMIVGSNHRDLDRPIITWQTAIIRVNALLLLLVGRKLTRLKGNICNSNSSKQGARTRGPQARRLHGLILVARRCHLVAPGVQFRDITQEDQVLR